MSPFASFRYRNYRWLWAANVCYGAVQGAQGFLVIWLVIESLDRDYDNGLFDLTMALPFLLLGLLAGHLADRQDRRLMLLGSHVAVALTLLLTAVLAAGDVLALPGVLLLGLLAAAGMAFGRPVRLALIPALVPRERILNANVLSELGMGLGAIAGIPLTGLVLDRWPVESAFVILAAVSFFGALFLMPLRVPPRDQMREGADPAPEAVPSTIWGDIAEGFRFLWGKRELQMLFLLLLVASLVSPGASLDFGALRDQLDISVREWALLSLFLGVGAIVATLALAFVRSVKAAGAWYGTLVMVVALSAMGTWFSTSYGLTGFLMSLYGLALGVEGLLFLTLVQSRTPIAVMGRVMGIFVTLTAATVLLSPLIVRAGQALLRDDGWVVCSAIVLVGVVAFVLARNPRLRRMPSHPEERDEAAEAGPG